MRLSLDLYFFEGRVLPKLGEGGFDWKPIRKRLLTGYYHSVAAFARAGNDLVVDHIFEDQAGFEEFMAALTGIDLFLVGVHCPLEELERRERSRGDRRVGDARKDLETVHTFCDYRVEVDSTLTPGENAELIWVSWNAQK